MRKVLAVFFLLITTICHSQTSDSSKWVVTLRPLGIIDPLRPNITLGAQYKIAEKTFVELQGGLMQSLGKYDFNEQKNISITGFRGVVEVKYKLVRKFFVGVQAFHNNFDRKDDEFIWRSGRAYEQKTNVTRKFAVTGAHLKCGVMLNPGRKRLYLECYGGVGVRYKKVVVSDLPPDGEIQGGSTGTGNGNEGNDVQPFNFESDVNLRGGNEVMPSAMLGFSVGIKL